MSSISQKNNSALSGLKELLEYRHDTGVFYWLKATGPRAKVGQPAGHANRTGRVTIHVNGMILKAHRLAWFFHTGTWPTGFIDHKDGDPSNNAISNLRLATPSQNKANSGTENPLGKGVSLVKGRYRASITVNYRRIYLGLFDTPQEAAKCYAEAATKHFGEYARCR